MSEQTEQTPEQGYETLTYEVDGDGIATITLDRPDALNAFTVQMHEELVDVFGRVSADDTARAVVVTGSGRAFCAGMDLSREGNVFGIAEDRHPTPADVRERPLDPDILDGIRDTGGKVTLAIFRCTKPVIAAINGPAVGIGATMTCAMDFRLASTKARIGFVFGRLGIVPEAASSWFLPRIVGLETALELCYAADVRTAEEMHEVGFVRSVHEPDDLLPAARELARRLTAGRSPVGVALTRWMLYRNAAADHPFDAHAVESIAMQASSTGDGKEGVAAFLAKRDADFTSRASELPPFVPWDPRDEIVP